MKNRNFYIVSQLLRGTWLIDPAHAQSHLPLVHSYLNGQSRGEPFKGFDKGEETEPAPSEPDEYTATAFAGPIGAREYYDSYEEAPAGSTAIIRVNGSLMKQNYCGAPGTATLKAQLQQADRHQNIGGHVLLIDSPGGTVDGTKDFADAVKAASKPVVAYVDGLAASAAFWIASAADEIIASNTTTMLGSIGTMISLADYRGMYEEWGIKEHHIFADKSADKNRTYLEALDGNYKPIRELSLNPINEIFLAAVRANRPDVSEKALTGKVFLAQDAMAMGLADSIGDFEFALERLDALTANSTSQVQTTNKDMFTKNKFPAMTALIGMTLLTEDALNAANEELQAAGIENATIVTDASLEEMTAESGRLSTAAAAAELTTAQDRIATLETEAAAAATSLQAMTAERDAAQALATEYGAKPGADHTDPIKPEGDQLEEEDSLQAELDKLPHNQLADQSL